MSSPPFKPIGSAPLGDPSWARITLVTKVNGEQTGVFPDLAVHDGNTLTIDQGVRLTIDVAVGQEVSDAPLPAEAPPAESRESERPESMETPR